MIRILFVYLKIVIKNTKIGYLLIGKLKKKSIFFLKMAEIVLDEDQFKNVQRINSILNQHSICYDTSKSGAGKTRMCCYICKFRCVKRIIVVCNNNLQINLWKSYKEVYDLPFVNILTYDNLRGSKNLIMYNGREMLPHYLLYKVNDEYYPTEIFMSWVSEGLALIGDEFHSIKNKSGKRSAFKALSSFITIFNFNYNVPVKSFTYFISMTPFDKEEHCVNSALTCGVIPFEPLFDEISKRPYGLSFLYNYCKNIDPINTQKIWGMYDVTEKNAEEITYKLIVGVFLRHVSSFTRNSNRGYLSKQSIYYAYFSVPEEAHRLMRIALSMINANKTKCDDIESLIINSFNNEEDTTQQTCQPQQILDIDSYNFSCITNGNGNPLRQRNGIIPGIITIHSIKTYFIILDFVTQIFNQIPNSKVVVFLNYKESINIIMRFLAMYNPVKITGDVECTEEKRIQIMNKFNEPNLESRLLIIISQIGSDSIELDDKHGSFPRVGLAFPDFYYSKYFQCPGRFHRRNSMSNSLFFFCLINSYDYSEESVENSIIEKSKVMEETLQNNEIIPPSNYIQIVDPHIVGLKGLLDSAGMIEGSKTLKSLVVESQPKITLPSIIKKF